MPARKPRQSAKRKPKLAATKSAKRALGKKSPGDFGGLRKVPISILGVYASSMQE